MAGRKFELLVWAFLVQMAVRLLEEQWFKLSDLVG